MGLNSKLKELIQELLLELLSYYFGERKGDIVDIRPGFQGIPRSKSRSEFIRRVGHFIVENKDMLFDYTIPYFECSSLALYMRLTERIRTMHSISTKLIDCIYELVQRQEVQSVLGVKSVRELSLDMFRVLLLAVLTTAISNKLCVRVRVLPELEVNMLELVQNFFNVLIRAGGYAEHHAELGISIRLHALCFALIATLSEVHRRADAVKDLPRIWTVILPALLARKREDYHGEEYDRIQTLNTQLWDLLTHLWLVAEDYLSDYGLLGILVLAPIRVALSRTCREASNTEDFMLEIIAQAARYPQRGFGYRPAITLPGYVLAQRLAFSSAYDLGYWLKIIKSEIYERHILKHRQAIMWTLDQAEFRPVKLVEVENMLRTQGMTLLEARLRLRTLILGLIAKSIIRIKPIIENGRLAIRTVDPFALMLTSTVSFTIIDTESLRNLI